MNEIMFRQPVAGVSRNPMLGLRSSDMQLVPVGVSFMSLAEKVEAEGLLICIVNGTCLSRLTREQDEHVQAVKDAGGNHEELFRAYSLHALNWRQCLTEPNDVIEWHDRPLGREGIRVLLQVALLLAIIIPGGQVFVPYLAAANFAYNLLVPPRQPEVAGQAGSVFSTSLAGNAARLDQAIWRNCGRVKITPPFAAQPYYEYLPPDPAAPTVDNDQYYYALFCIGYGNHEVEKALIGKTSIHHFEDVVTAQYLAPGVQPSTVLANVVTSDEVTNSELEDYRYVGGFAASRPGDLVDAIGIDVSAGQGLYSTSGNRTAEWQVEIREINDFGAPIGDWTLIAVESRTANTTTPQRWSSRYELSTPMRCEVRVARTDTKSTVPEAVDGIQWIGLRAYLNKPAPLNEHCAHYEVVMRASEQLSAFNQRDFSMIVRAFVRTWNPITGWGATSGDANESFTRNAAWWLADLWTNPIWGEGIDEDRVDLQGLYDWSLTLDARQDRFDYCFSSSKESWEAAQLIAGSGRARVFRRNGIYTLARDEFEDLPITAFSTRNTQPKSIVVHTKLPSFDQPNGVIVEYQSNITWDLASIECPCPGYSVANTDDPRFDPLLPPMDRPFYIKLEGVTGATHAEREGLYQAADMMLRTSTASTKVEMEGTIVAFMDPVRLQPPMRGYGQTGDVAFWDENTLIMGLTEQPDFSGSQPYLTLIRDEGTLTTPVLVTPGPTVWDITLPDLPDFDITFDEAHRERTRFLLGHLTEGDELVKITSIADGGKSDEGSQLFDIEAVIDVTEVHEADNHLLPGPGDIQDPIDDGLDYSDEAGGLILLRLTNREIQLVVSDQMSTVHATFRLLTTGQAQSEVRAEISGVNNVLVTTNLSAEWTTQPLEPGLSANYDVYVSQVGADPASMSGTFDTWLNLGTAREWSANALPDFQTVAYMTVKLRRAGSTLVQTQRAITLNAWSQALSGGP